MSKHIKRDGSPKNDNSGIILLPRVWDFFKIIIVI